MHNNLLGAISAIALSTVASFSSAEEAPERIYSWTRMAWNFENINAQQSFEDAKVYSHAPLAGVEADAAGEIYVTTPRWIDAAVPSTLSRVVNINGSALLEPFPSWEAHELSNVDGIRNALGVFIDNQQRMWIVDMGWVAGEESVPDGAQKLIGIDLVSGEEFVRFEITDDLADRSTSFLNDLVVDEAGETIYITDSGNRGGSPVPAGIIIYDIASNTARRVLDQHSSVQDDPNLWLKVDGKEVFDGSRLAVGINGITISADGKRVYWSITTGDAIYSVPVALLRDPEATDSDIADQIEGPLRIGGGSDGIATGSDGRLWITNLALNRLEVLEPGEIQTHILAEGPDFIWPDSLARDFNGGMLLSVNHLNSAFGGVLDYDGNASNFSVWRFSDDQPALR